MADARPPLYIMKKLVSMYNHDLKIPRFSKLNKDDLHQNVTQRKYKWFKKDNDTWGLKPLKNTKRQQVYTFNKKTKEEKKRLLLKIRKKK